LPCFHTADHPMIPKPKRSPVKVSRHGRTVLDDYAWMRADNWREALSEPELLPKEIKDHLAVEDAYARSVLAGSAELRDELLSALPDRDPGPEPILFTGAWIYATDDTVDGYSRIVRRPADGGAWECIIDCSAEAAVAHYWDLGDIVPSPDHQRIAYFVDTEGDESYVLRVRDVASGTDLADRIEGAAGTAAWSADGTCLLYTALDADHRPTQVHCHRLGALPTTATIVYAEPDPAMEIYLDQPLPGGSIIVEVTSHTTTEVRLIDPVRPLESPALFAPRARATHTRLAPTPTGFVVTRWMPGAEDGTIDLVPIEANSAVRRVVPAGSFLEDVVAARDWIARVAQNGLAQSIVLRRLEGDMDEIMPCDEPGATFELFSPASADTNVLHYVIESPLRPRRVMAVDIDTSTTRCLWSDVSGSDHTAYIMETLAARAPDGTDVPITLLARRDRPRDPAAVLWLEAYGAYGDPCRMDYSPVRLAAMDRGMICAVAHVRGGGDLGRAWAEAAQGVAKPLSFTDYIVCATHLVAEGWTKAGRIVAAGESAGGLLVGVVLNLAPELFLAAYARVPFVDPLNTMLDSDLPLTPGEWPEWGNPIDSAVAFDTIAGYSPYDNVAAKSYPPVLATASLSDQRVTYWEPAKWIARLRDRSTSNSAMVLDLNWAAGHDGAQGSDERMVAQATAFAFVLSLAKRLEPSFVA
jgi:oligopeptidase B